MNSTEQKKIYTVVITEDKMTEDLLVDVMNYMPTRRIRHMENMKEAIELAVESKLNDFNLL